LRGITESFVDALLEKTLPNASPEKKAIACKLYALG
jgi:hypothetical protein